MGDGITERIRLMDDYYRFRICGIVLAAAVFLGGCSVFPEEEVFETAVLVKEYEQKEFTMVAVQRGDVCSYNRIMCKYVESEKQEITVSIWNPVKEIYVREGDKVKKGDLLLSYEGTDVENEIDDYVYQIKVMEAEIRQAETSEKLEIEKQKCVLDDETALKAIRERYSAEISGYRSELELLNMKLESAQAELEAYQVRAEMDGTVVSVNSEMNFDGWFNDWGSSVYGHMEDSAAVMTISDGSRPKFVGAVDSDNQDIQLEDGQEIDVMCNDYTYHTKVRYKDAWTVYFIPDETIYDVKDGDLGVAMDIIDERKDVLYLPDSAIKKMGSETVVYREDENGFKNPVVVKTGLSANNRTEIISGLSEGDLVIVR